MKHINRFLIFSTGALCFFSASSAPGIRVDHLGVNNTLVRIEGDGRYLLLPVQEDVDDAGVNVLVDGNLARSINVRLAKNRIDYFVPFDLAPYRDGAIALNIVSNHGRSSVREAKSDACWANIELSDSFDVTNREKYRPVFHHTPLYGWMNDPNGMFYKDGVWHLYYQYNPYGSRWQNLSWGHSSSTDLINWRHHPTAIEPNGFGMVFSGSCVVDSMNTAGFGKGAVVALYTSAAHSQIQSVAHSNDGGETFETYSGNPVITLESEARDPNMFWNEATGEWNLLLAHALDHEMLLFTSPDLKEWTLQSDFGKGLGAQGGVWECPDLMELPVEGTGESRWVLICNLNPGGIFGGSATQYFVGNFDGKKFVADRDANGNVPTKWLDYGKDHYATVSWSNAPEGRHTVIGWMSNWQYADVVPTKQYRSANTLPRDLALFIGDDGQYYVSVKPSPEMEMLKNKQVVNAKGVGLSTSPKSYRLPSDNDGVCQIDLSIDSRKAQKVLITLSNQVGDEVSMVFDADAMTFSMDRTKSGVVDFSTDFPAVTVAPLERKSDKIALRLFIDRSSIEAFAGNGDFAMTNLVFPTAPYTTLSIATAGGKALMSSLRVYSISTDK